MLDWDQFNKEAGKEEPKDGEYRHPWDLGAEGETCPVCAKPVAGRQVWGHDRECIQCASPLTPGGPVRTLTPKASPAYRGRLAAAVKAPRFTFTPSPYLAHWRGSEETKRLIEELSSKVAAAKTVERVRRNELKEVRRQHPHTSRLVRSANTAHQAARRQTDIAKGQLTHYRRIAKLARVVGADEWAAQRSPDEWAAQRGAD